MEWVSECSEMARQWASFGLGGMVIFSLFLFVWFLMRAQRDERGMWQESLGKFNDTLMALVREVEAMNLRGRRYDTKE